MTKRNPDHILLLGGTGLLGGHLTVSMRNKGCKITTVARSQADINIDLSNNLKFEQILNEVCPTVIINCAALTDVDYCQAHILEALQFNAFPNIVITEYCKNNKNSKFVFISTDHVYNNHLKNGEDNIDLVNSYGYSKRAGEEIALRHSSMVLRVNFFGDTISGGSKGLFGWIKNNALNHKKIRGLTDVYFSPLTVQNLSEQIQISLDNYTPGIYNIGASDGISKYEFCKYIYRLMGEDTSLVFPTRQEDLHFEAKRPSYMVMDVSKYERLTKQNLSSVTQQIDELFKIG
jgi:dTDP-4-dehydrorhamnose reductase